MKFLMIIGSGISAGQMTFQAQEIIKSSEIVLYVINDPLSIRLIKKLNKNSKSLKHLYGEDKNRKTTYKEMTNYIMAQFKTYLKVCIVFYGHPGILAESVYLCVDKAKKKGIIYKILPGISAEACLYSDLEIDPISIGIQSYEATQFILNRHIINVNSYLVLWQLGVIGDLTYKTKFDLEKPLKILKRQLLEYYPPDHLIIIYEASIYPILEPKILKIKIGELTSNGITKMSTLFVPNLKSGERNDAVINELGINPD